MPTMLQRVLILQFRSILEQNMVADSFAEHFPPSWKEYLLKKMLTPFTERNEDADEDADEDEVSCAICKRAFVVEQPVKATNCNHIFGEYCILSWLEKNGSCPLCRTEILPIFSDRGEFKTYIRRQNFMEADERPSPPWLVAIFGFDPNDISEGPLFSGYPFEIKKYCQKVDPTSLGKEVLQWQKERKTMTMPKIMNNIAAKSAVVALGSQFCLAGCKFISLMKMKNR